MLRIEGICWRTSWDRSYRFVPNLNPTDIRNNFETNFRRRSLWNKRPLRGARTQAVRRTGVVASGCFYGPLKPGHEDFAASLPLLPIWLSCQRFPNFRLPNFFWPETSAQPLLRSCAKHETVSGRESLTPVPAAQRETSNNGRNQTSRGTTSQSAYTVFPILARFAKQDGFAFIRPGVRYAAVRWKAPIIALMFYAEEDSYDETRKK
jgi:hypothetical protein